MTARRIVCRECQEEILDDELQVEVEGETYHEECAPEGPPP